MAAGIETILDEYSLDVLMIPAQALATHLSAIGGYPIGTVPIGYFNDTGRPFGVAFLGRRWSEPTLISIM